MTKNKIIEGMKEALEHASFDSLAHDYMRKIADAAMEDGATWYDIRVSVKHGKKERRLTQRGGPSY